MRVLYVVPRYGPQAAGGAEGACRSFATRMAASGHEVEVVTIVRGQLPRVGQRLARGHGHRGRRHGASAAGRRAPRPRAVLGGLDARAHRPSRRAVARAARLARTSRVLASTAWRTCCATGPTSVDVAVVLPYLYLPAFTAITTLAGRAPIVFHPCAHDEPPLRLPVYERLFRLSDALGFFTEEEAALVRRRFRIDRPSAVTGIGVDVDIPHAPPPHIDGVGERPYLVCVGRIDPGKGTLELVEWFGRYKDAHPGPLALVLVGDRANEVAPHPDVFLTGIVDEPTKQAIVEAALAFVQPSHYESFSIVLMEAWAVGQGGGGAGTRAPCSPAHARRSGGALPYRNEEELGEVLDLLVVATHLCDSVSVRRAVRTSQAHFQWPDVLARHESLLDQAVVSFGSPHAQR